MSYAHVPWNEGAVIYQVYPKSFADGDGDGVGDLVGLRSRLGALVDLGIDAIWISPFYRSPQRDGGYDVSNYVDVDPMFGGLGQFRELCRDAHARGIRVIVDLVPNHTSTEHSWFKQATGTDASPSDRSMYIIREGRNGGALPPNNWQSEFGGEAWTRVPSGSKKGSSQWYLHLFDSSQADLDWSSDRVREEFRRILRFWLDLGVDGFRVDVAHALVKAEGLPDVNFETEESVFGDRPYWAQPGVHEIFRDWRRVIDEGAIDRRILVAEAWVRPPERLAEWVREDEMDQAFNFEYLEMPWSGPDRVRQVVDTSLRTTAAVGKLPTWVLSNHDIVRVVTRLSVAKQLRLGHGISEEDAAQGDLERGKQLARAAALFTFGLPGAVYVYQGDELGLPEVTDLAPEQRQDPAFHRTNGEIVGRDGCRVPLPWSREGESFGFNSSGKSWLPQPQGWGDLSREAQADDPRSTLHLYKSAIKARKEGRLGVGEHTWLPLVDEGLVGFRNGDTSVVINLGSSASQLPSHLGRAFLSSDERRSGEMIPPRQCRWYSAGDQTPRPRGL